MSSKDCSQEEAVSKEKITADAEATTTDEEFHIKTMGQLKSKVKRNQELKKNQEVFEDNAPFICGVVEGFYGKPWTAEQRKELFCR